MLMVYDITVDKGMMILIRTQIHIENKIHEKKERNKNIAYEIKGQVVNYELDSKGE